MTCVKCNSGALVNMWFTSDVNYNDYVPPGGTVYLSIFGYMIGSTDYMGQICTYDGDTLVASSNEFVQTGNFVSYYDYIMPSHGNDIQMNVSLRGRTSSGIWYCEDYRTFTVHSSANWLSMQVAQGNGTVNVYKNDSLLGSVSNGEGTKSWWFINHDTAKFQSTAASGYVYNKICTTDDAWCTTSNPYQFTIAGGYAFKALFNQTVAQGYNCSNCNTPVDGGQYPTTAQCQAACAPAQKYSCQGTPPACTPVDSCSGTNCYTESTCNSQCAPAVTHLECDNITKKCVTKSGSGDNKDGCKSVGQACCQDPLNLGCTYGIPNTYIVGGIGILLMMKK